MLSSYSADTYKSWGLSGTSESNMSDFINNVDKTIVNKLFDRIKSIDLRITNAELVLLKSMLHMNGYKLTRNKFSKKGEPLINYFVDEQPGKSKVQRIIVILSRETESRIISLGSNGQITFSGKQVDFTFK